MSKYNDLEYNPPLTVGRLKKLLEGIDDNVHINVLNSDKDMTANINVWHEDCNSREYVELKGFKPFYKMNDDELEYCYGKDETNE